MKDYPAFNAFGAHCFHLAECVSTQDELKSLLGHSKEGLAEGTAIIADFQTGGRGRLPGRQWISAHAENMLMSVYLDKARGQLPGLPLRLGFALLQSCEAYAACTHKPAQGQTPAPANASANAPEHHIPRFGIFAIKWPNDLYFENKKLGGIICENTLDGVIVGVGLNCNQKSYDKDLASKAISLGNILNHPINISEIISLFLFHLKEILVDSGWQHSVHKRLLGVGCPATAVLADGSMLAGTIKGIDNKGGLLLECARELVCLYSCELNIDRHG